MKFCPRCGALMRVRVRGGVKVYVCPQCGYEEEAKTPVRVASRRINHSERERVVVIEGDTPTGLPKVKVTCPRCGYEEAYYWIQQTRAADEPSTRFYKCVKCGYVWRDYE